MAAQVRFAVVGHHRRRQQAEALAESLGAHLLMDEGDHGAAWNHRRALEWAAGQGCRVVVLEDDAVPAPGFAARSSEVVGMWADDLVSLYLGTGRPPQWQERVRAELRLADEAGRDHIALPELIHAVAYSIPQWAVAEVLDALPSRTAADFAIGRAWRRVAGTQVVYTIPSLVDHQDGPSVERHPDGQRRTERRRAWRVEEMS